MYTVVLFEDEQEAADTLASYLHQFEQEEQLALQLIHFTSPLQVEHIEATHADLLIMDIALPGQDGFSYALQLREQGITTPLIFTTNLTQFALRGYQASAIDYILKPIQYGNFRMAMRRAVQQIRQRQQQSIVLKQKNGLKTVELDRIVEIHAKGHYVELTLDSGVHELTRSSMKNLPEILKQDPFLQVAAGQIINMNYIDSLEHNQLTLHNGTTVWISRTYKVSATARIVQFLSRKIA